MKNLLLIYLLTYSIAIIAQNELKRRTVSDIDSLPMIEGFERTNFIPITYQKLGAEFKKEFKVSGVIIEQSSAGFLCGVVCHSGTMKIEIDNSKDVHDSSRFIYLLIPCYVHDETDIGKTIDVTLTNLPEDRDIGCYKNVWNTIDSKGEAFYYCEKREIK